MHGAAARELYGSAREMCFVWVWEGSVISFGAEAARHETAKTLVWPMGIWYSPSRSKSNLEDYLAAPDDPVLMTVVT
jgi:hypothetical protein